MVPTHEPLQTHVCPYGLLYLPIGPTLALSPGHFQTLSRSGGENREKAWDHCDVTGRKWCIRLVHNVDSVRTESTISSL